MARSALLTTVMVASALAVIALDAEPASTVLTSCIPSGVPALTSIVRLMIRPSLGARSPTWHSTALSAATYRHVPAPLPIS